MTEMQRDLLEYIQARGILYDVDLLARPFRRSTIQAALSRGWIEECNGGLALTAAGKQALEGKSDGGRT